MAAPYRHTDMRTLTALLILLIVALPGVALAHAQLRASELAEGAVVASAPTEIVLRFNEPISPLLLRLIGPDGTATDVEGSAENEDLTVRLPAELAEGTHLLSWRIVSADGHPVGGTLTFHIGSASAAPPVSMEPASGAARAVASLRFVLTTALIMAVGSAVFAGLVARSPMGSGAVRLAQLSAILSLPAGAALLGAQGLDLAALPPAALLTSAPWKVVATAPLTLTVVLSAGAAACAFVALRARSGRAAGAAGLAAWGLAGLTEQNTERLTPVFDEENPIGATGLMRTWYTTKPCFLTNKSHISHLVGDSAWEGHAANVFEKRDDVLAYAKNDHLGFQIYYMWAGSRRRYVPDFLVRLAGGAILALEIKGTDSPQNKAKRDALNEWVKAINAAGGFGRWDWDVAFKPGEVQDIITKHAAVAEPAE